MSSSRRTASGCPRDDVPLCRATIRTTTPNADIIANAIRPDNTPEMTTCVNGQSIETTIERETPGGLRTTADDYVMNLSVAVQIMNQPNPTMSEHQS